VFRCPARSTFTAVEDFVRSGKTEAAITLAPRGAKPITLRAIRMESPDGELSVLLTNLPDEPRFAAAAVIALYFRRWAVELNIVTEKPPSTSKPFTVRPRTASARNCSPS